jgi:uncharacterized membrane protein YqiK
MANSLQEEEKNKAVAKAKSATEIQQATDKKEIERLKSETEAQTQLSSRQADIQAEVYKIKEIAKANLEAAESNFQTAEKESQVVLKMAQAEGEKGKAEAAVMLAKVEAENAISQARVNADIIRAFIPLLPKIVESLMLPAEKIESIKFININGLEGFTHSQGHSGIPQATNTPFFNTLLNTILNAGILWPVIKEVVSAFKTDQNQQDILEIVKNIPGGELMLELIKEKFSDQQLKEIQKDSNEVGTKNE